MTFNNELRREGKGTVAAGSGFVCQHLRVPWASKLFFGGGGGGRAATVIWAGLWAAHVRITIVGVPNLIK